MATIKKYNGSTWENAVVRKYGTASEIIVPPTTIYANGQPISTYTIKGNTVQSGTPTPSAPISVNGVGNKTANLTSTNTWKNADTTDTRSYFSVRFYVSGGVQAFANVTQIGEYTLTLTGLTNETVQFKHNGAARDIRIFEYTCNFSEPTDLTVSFYANGYNPTELNGIDLTNIMMNTGSQPLPYEPYGYKIPISSANTTTPVYLGEVETTRKVKKLMLTGEESGWQASPASEGRNRFVLSIPNAMQADTTHFTSLSTHLPLGVEGATWNTDDIYTIVSSKIYIRLTAQYNTLADFKSYLAAQYANGTPFTVWYVLATPTTGIVNEPLIKIGNYSDSISNATAIPTSDGANSITVDTTVQPSEFTATWTGWHDSSVKEWDGSDWQ